jgi:valyl-tRNA synthetase
MTTKLHDDFLQPYDSTVCEAAVQSIWNESGFYNPDRVVEAGIISADAPKFSMIMPPPNVTGVLHMGHGLMVTVQDIMIRYKRMQGFKTLWLPGTDHAAIATQSKVEKEIQKAEGKSRHDLGRTEMLRRIGEFAQNSHDTIVSQVNRMGASCDWSREAFTLDEKRNAAVNTVFKKMFDDGLIYRKERVINWDPKGQTTISDDEIVHEARKATLYTFKYAADFPIPISTTRPETKIGDTAVAVHPSDTRYAQYVGQEFTMQFCGQEITVRVVADEAVEPEFGTGALGVTPAHAQIDAEIAERHGLPMKSVINEYAKMISDNPDLNGKKTTEAREMVAQWLRDNNLMISEAEIDQNISTAERTGGIIEPLPKLQWFVDVNRPFILAQSKIPGINSGASITLKQLMITAVESGAIKILPEHFSKTYFHWVENLRDWCISRQIWYGHRIPVYYKGDEIFVGNAAPGDDWSQDEDTLDTWFSSALWTFSTLGWPENTDDLAVYHPTDVLETGYEILFFWVARMILMTGYCLGDIPFHTVYLHGTVRDGQGRKMSKSLGNGIDPIDVADQFGADAGRLALIMGTAPGTDSRIDMNKIKGQRNFCNKLWNISRFVISSAPEGFERTNDLTDTDKALISEWETLIAQVTTEMDTHQYHIAAEKLYQYAWTRFASEIIEESKPLFAAGGDTATSRMETLIRLLTGILTSLHPFVPHVTESIWQRLPDSFKSNQRAILMVCSWPTH